MNLILVDVDAWSLTAGGFAIWAFPIYLAVLNGGIVALVARGRTPLAAAASPSSGETCRPIQAEDAAPTSGPSRESPA